MEVEWPLKEEEIDLKVWSKDVVKDTQCSAAELDGFDMNYYETLL